jgi:hypothetical protein
MILYNVGERRRNNYMVSDTEFLKSMAKAGNLLDHNVEICGQCYYNKLCSDVAREMLISIEKGEDGADKDIVKRWDNEHHKRWEESKYYKLYVEELRERRDPRKAFDERGWIM